MKYSRLIVNLRAGMKGMEQTVHSKNLKKFRLIQITPFHLLQLLCFGAEYQVLNLDKRSCMPGMAMKASAGVNHSSEYKCLASVLF